MKTPKPATVLMIGGLALAAFALVRVMTAKPAPVVASAPIVAVNGLSWIPTTAWASYDIKW